MIGKVRAKKISELKMVMSLALPFAQLKLNIDIVFSE